MADQQSLFDDEPEPVPESRTPHAEPVPDPGQPTPFELPLPGQFDPAEDTPLRPPGEDRPAPAHADAVDTEQEAAEMVRPKAGTGRADALAALRWAWPDGLTDQELSEHTGQYLYTIAPRRVELTADGWAEDSGMRRVGLRNRNAVVWRLTVRAAVELGLPVAEAS